MTKHKYSTQILENQLDSFGHVNNAVYMELYEEARWDLITSVHVGYSEIQASQKGPIILEANLKFKRELLNREKIQIKSTFIELQKSKIAVLSQIIEKEDGTISSEAIFKIGYMDTVERKLINVPEEWLAFFS